MDGFSGYETATAEELTEATAVMDPFHVLALAGEKVDQCRQRIQQATLGHRGRSGDPLYGIRRVLYTGADERLIASLPSCPIPEVARLGKTLRRWQTTFLAYFDTDGASNGGTEAINGIIELARRIARGFRNFEHHRLRMLLMAGGGLDASPHPQL